MGYTISCDLTLPEQHPAHYWWPLVFEVLGRHQFSFDNPWYRPRHEGVFSRFDEDAGDTGLYYDCIEAASFRTLWDAICTAPANGTVSFMPTFWSMDPDLVGWDMECLLKVQPSPTASTHSTVMGEPSTVTEDTYRTAIRDERAQPNDSGDATLWRLSCYISALEGDKDISSSQELLPVRSLALSRFVALACDLFAACGASTAEFNYEWVGVVARFGTIGMPLALEWWASPSEHESYEATVDEVALPSGSMLTIVNPFDLFPKGPPIPLDLPR